MRVGLGDCRGQEYKTDRHWDRGMVEVLSKDGSGRVHDVRISNLEVDGNNYIGEVGILVRSESHFCDKADTRNECLNSTKCSGMHGSSLHNNFAGLIANSENLLMIVSLLRRSTIAG